MLKLQRLLRYLLQPWPLLQRLLLRRLLKTLLLRLRTLLQMLQNKRRQ
jgi:hypothetical protein